VSLIIRHIPHIIPAVLALAFLIRFAVHARRMPPADLTDEQLAEWQAARAQPARSRLPIRWTSRATRR